MESIRYPVPSWGCRTLSGCLGLHTISGRIHSLVSSCRRGTYEIIPYRPDFSSHNAPCDCPAVCNKRIVGKVRSSGTILIHNIMWWRVNKGQRHRLGLKSCSGPGSRLCRIKGRTNEARKSPRPQSLRDRVQGTIVWRFSTDRSDAYSC